ncbi:MAG: tryptophan synthase subunit alpha [Terriglobales bacterium]
MALCFQSRPALVAYVTCGDPDLGTTREIVLAALGSGADVVELGVPFSDPVSDGPVIQRACQRALQNGTRLRDVLALAGQVRKHSDGGLVVFSYLNPVLRFGLREFCDAAAAAGVDGALITDLPVEEAGEYLRLMRARKLDTVFLAAPTSTDERLRRIAEASRGFVYAVARTGVTGARKAVGADALGLVKRLRQFTELPIALGFGISTAQQVRAVGRFADAAVVGSAIVQAVERCNNPRRAPLAVAKLVATLAAACRGTPASARNPARE